MRVWDAYTGGTSLGMAFRLSTVYMSSSQFKIVGAQMFDDFRVSAFLT